MTDPSYIRTRENKLDDTVLLVEADYRYPDAWLEIDSEHIFKLEMME